MEFLESHHLPFGPLVIILAVLSIPWLAIFLDFLKKRRIMDHLHVERLAAIEKGLDLSQVPGAETALLADRAWRPPNHLLRGMLWTLIGISLAVVLAVREDLQTASFGLLPAAVGIANLIYYFCVGRKQILTTPAKL